MNKVIKPHALFHTPETLEELQRWIDQHPADQRAHLTTAAFMMWNFLAKELCPNADELLAE